MNAARAALMAGLLSICQFLSGCVSADRLLLHPTTHPVSTEGAVAEKIPFESGVVEIWKAQTPAARSSGPQAYVLTFYGNADRADRWPAREVSLWKDHAVEIWGVNHPGFGGSTGPARLDRIAGAATAALNHLQTVARGKPIIVSGTSVGTVAALHLAGHHGVSGVIARSPTPLRETAMRHGWWNLWLLAGPVAVQIPPELDSVKNARTSSAPAVFLLTAKDDLVTPNCQRMVIDAYRGEKRTQVLASAGHNSSLTAAEQHDYEELLSWLFAKAAKGR